MGGALKNDGRLDKLPIDQSWLFKWTVLTASRVSEGLLANWSEIDLEHGTWTVDGDRMKGRRAHRVPLSSQCEDVLEESMALTGGSGALFPSCRQGVQRVPATKRHERMAPKQRYRVHHARLSIIVQGLGSREHRHGNSFKAMEYCLAHYGPSDGVVESYLQDGPDKSTATNHAGVGRLHRSGVDRTGSKSLQTPDSIVGGLFLCPFSVVSMPDQSGGRGPPYRGGPLTSPTLSLRGLWLSGHHEPLDMVSDDVRKTHHLEESDVDRLLRTHVFWLERQASNAQGAIMARKTNAQRNREFHQRKSSTNDPGTGLERRNAPARTV